MILVFGFDFLSFWGWVKGDFLFGFFAIYLCCGDNKRVILSSIIRT